MNCKKIWSALVVVGVCLPVSAFAAPQRTATMNFQCTAVEEQESIPSVSQNFSGQITLSEPVDAVTGKPTLVYITTSSLFSFLGKTYTVDAIIQRDGKVGQVCGATLHSSAMHEYSTFGILSKDTGFLCGGILKEGGKFRMQSRRSYDGVNYPTYFTGVDVECEFSDLTFNK